MCWFKGLAKKLVMPLEAGESVEHFKWAEWIDAAMGFIKGMDKIMEKELPKHIVNWRKRTPSKCDLTIPIQTISVPNPEIPHLPGDIHIWMGWPFFDIKLVHFEMNQWMQAAGYMHGFCNIVGPKVQNRETKFKEEVTRAEEGWQRIMEWNRR